MLGGCIQVGLPQPLAPPRDFAKSARSRLTTALCLSGQNAVGWVEMKCPAGFGAGSPVGTEYSSIFRPIPNSRATARWLCPSTRAARTRSFGSTVYMPPVSHRKHDPSRATNPVCHPLQALAVRETRIWQRFILTLRIHRRKRNLCEKLHSCFQLIIEPGLRTMRA